MGKKKRVALAKEMISQLSNKPKSLTELSEALNEKRTVVAYVSRQLKEAGLLKVVTGPTGGIMRKKEPSEVELLQALGYYSAPKPFQCDLCDEKKARIKEKSPTSSKVYFVDAAGKRWDGFTCPDCVEIDNTVAYGKALTLHLSTRKCRECNKFLTKDRYFNCIDCMPELSSMDDDYIYEATEMRWDDFSFAGDGEDSIALTKQEAEDAAD